MSDVGRPFDLVILDMTTPFPYERQTLEVQGLGGTEASVIRVAEGLGSIGARVAVVEHNLKEPLMGEHAFYLPMSYLEKIKAHNFVSLRGTHGFSLFPKARHLSWHEDVGNEIFASMRDDFVRHKVTVIAASDWHKRQLSGLIHKENADDNPPIVRIYNPIDESIFVPKHIDVKYDRNKLCWVASPHKGFKEGVEIFNKLVRESGNENFRLFTFNPGYMLTNMPELFQNKYVVDVGPVPCRDLWQHVSESLCLFYPTTFEETFGNIAAEANAVHTPVLTCKVAALEETVSSEKQYVPVNDPDAVIKKVMEWHRGDRPKVWGNDKFRATEVLKDWVRLLSRHVYM